MGYLSTFPLDRPKSINNLQASFRSGPSGCQYNITLLIIMRNAPTLLLVFKCHYLVSIIFVSLSLYYFWIHPLCYPCAHVYHQIGKLLPMCQI